MPPATRKRAPRKAATTPPEPTVVVTAAEYTEDPDWDGTPEETSTMPTEPIIEDDAPIAKKTRTVSPLVAASRAYDKANKRADKARAAAVKVKNVADELTEAEEAETAAYSALSALLGR